MNEWVERSRKRNGVEKRKEGKYLPPINSVCSFVRNLLRGHWFQRGGQLQAASGGSLAARRLRWAEPREGRWESQTHHTYSDRTLKMTFCQW